MMRAKVGDYLVRRTGTVAPDEVVGVVTAVLAEDGGPPFIVRWNDGDGLTTKVNPNPERFWIRSQCDVRESGESDRNGVSADEEDVA